MMATELVAINPKPTVLSWRGMDSIERAVTVLVPLCLAAACVVVGEIVAIASMVL